MWGLFIFVFFWCFTLSILHGKFCEWTICFFHFSPEKFWLPRCVFISLNYFFFQMENLKTENQRNNNDFPTLFLCLLLLLCFKCNFVWLLLIFFKTNNFVKSNFIPIYFSFVCLLGVCLCMDVCSFCNKSHFPGGSTFNCWMLMLN